MKFACLFAAAMCIVTSSSAGTVYQYRDHTPALIDVEMFPRMKLWSNGRHTQSAEGHILVCNAPQEDSWVSGAVCYTPGSNKTKTAWVVLQDVAVPGFMLKAYELRSNGTLIAYYSQIKEPAVKK